MMHPRMSKGAQRNHYRTHIAHLLPVCDDAAVNTSPYAERFQRLDMMLHDECPAYRPITWVGSDARRTLKINAGTIYMSLKTGCVQLTGQFTSTSDQRRLLYIRARVLNETSHLNAPSDTDRRPSPSQRPLPRRRNRTAPMRTRLKSVLVRPSGSAVHPTPDVGTETRQRSRLQSVMIRPEEPSVRYTTSDARAVCLLIHFKNVTPGTEDTGRSWWMLVPAEPSKCIMYDDLFSRSASLYDLLTHADSAPLSGVLSLALNAAILQRMSGSDLGYTTMDLPPTIQSLYALVNNWRPMESPTNIPNDVRVDKTLVVALDGRRD